MLGGVFTSISSRLDSVQNLFTAGAKETRVDKDDIRNHKLNRCTIFNGFYGEYFEKTNKHLPLKPKECLFNIFCGLLKVSSSYNFGKTFQKSHQRHATNFQSP